MFWSDLRRYMSIQAQQPYIVLIFDDIYLQKKNKSGRLHEFYFRHPVRRKRSFLALDEEDDGFSRGLIWEEFYQLRVKKNSFHRLDYDMIDN